MARDVRPPEQVLEELYRTGRNWMLARSNERAYGPPSEWGKGDNPPRWQEPGLENRAAAAEHELRGRFENLVDEFIERVEEQ